MSTPPNARRVELITLPGGKIRAVVGAAALLGMVVRNDAPATTREVVDSMRGRLYAAVDGPMFKIAAGQPQTYTGFSRGVIEYRHVYPARGINHPGNYPTRGVSIYVANGAAGAESGAGTPKPGETFRAQTYPSLVTNGAATPGLTDVDTNNRPALGVLADGRVFIVLGQRVTMPELAAALAAWVLPNGARVTFAGYLDGGGSAALYVDDNLDGNPEFNFNLGGRRVISWITLEEKPSPVEVLREKAGDAVRAIKNLFIQPGNATGFAIAAGSVAVTTIFIVAVASTRK
jgi:hypothetical protein